MAKDTLIFDTDILIWAEKGNEHASSLIDRASDRKISVQSYMELLQCARSKQQHYFIKDFLIKLEFEILPFTENIGHRAAIYIEEYSLGNGMRAGDAIIAATAVENNLTLITTNKKHFHHISELKLKTFSP